VFLIPGDESWRFLSLESLHFCECSRFSQSNLQSRKLMYEKRTCRLL
jgi:hypothetical protein